MPERGNKGRETGLIIDPMAKLLGVAGEKNKSVLVLRTS